MKRKEIEEMSIEDKISYLATRYMLTISQWDDKWRSYRVGINWDYHREDGELEFLVEKPTLDMALNDVMEVAFIGFNEWAKLNQERKQAA